MPAPKDPRLVQFGAHVPKVAPDVFVADTARIIGDVVLGEGSSVWFGTVIRGDVRHIRIGQRVNLQDMTMVHVTAGRYATVIGDDVTVGHRATLHGCTIGNRCLIGMGATILDGAVVEDDAMVGAGAVVTPGKVIKSHTLWLGAPAKYKRDLSDTERAFLVHSAGHYQELAKRYLADGVGTL